MSTVLVSTTSTGRLFHREGAATQNARLASSVRVLGTIRRDVLEGRSVRDGMWSFSSELRYGGDDIRWALNVRVATLCVWCARGLAASVMTATEAWHWSCCCSASQHGPACFGSVAVCQVTSTARHTTVSYSSWDATRRCCTQSLRRALWTACAECRTCRSHL